MFSISDVMLDKEEVSLALSLPVHVPDDESAVPEPSIAEQIAIPDDENTIPKPYIKFVIGKVADILTNTSSHAVNAGRPVTNYLGYQTAGGIIVSIACKLSAPTGIWLTS